MPRYFFHLFDINHKDLVRDSEGALFADLYEARKEAIGLGQDIVRHGIHRGTWQIVITDENGDCGFTVPLAQIRACKMRAWLDLVHRIVAYEPRFRPQFFTWLLVAAVLAIITQAAIITLRIKWPGNNYQLASVSTEGSIITVQFIPGTSVADTSHFLATYKVSLISCSLPGGWYCLRLSDSIPRKKLENIVHKMRQENIVSSAAVGYGGDAH